MAPPSQNRPTAESTQNVFSEATRRLAQRHLHQSFWHESLRVTFATTSNFDQNDLPVVLFAGPMFGNRYHLLTFDKLARTTGVRAIYPDRPGFGGSTPVPASRRVQVWLETVPLLLEKLDVKHVSLVCHSAGTVFLLNTLLQHRKILDPKAPYVALLGPWVHSEHSKMAMTTALSKLPSGMISAWSDIVGFINLRVNPTASWSGGVFSTVSNLFQSEPKDANTDLQDKFGDEQVGKEIEKLQTKYMFAESMSGANDEARLCLKSDGDGFVGACENYERFVEVLCAQERKRNGRESAGPKLEVSMHFAESDNMSGKGGKEYFEKCWSQAGVEEVIEVRSTQYPGTNHETVLVDFKKGALRHVFETVASGRK